MKILHTIFDKRKNALVLFIFAVIAFAIYAGTISAEFVWDDEEQIVNNVMVQNIAYIPKLFGGSTFNTGGASSLTGVYYRPVMLVVFSILYNLGGGAAPIFHATQIALHIATAYIFYRFLSNLISRDTSFPKNMSQSVIIIFTILFLVHPLSVESVAYTSALQDVIYTLTGISALYCISATTAPTLRRFMISGGLLLVSIFSKETAIMFLLLFIIYALIYDKKHWYKYVCTSGVILGIYFFVRIFLIRVSFGDYDISPISALSFWERVITIPKVLWYYISSFVYPSDISVMQHWVVTSPSITNFWLPLSCVFLVFGTVLYVVYKTKSKYLLFCSLWSGLGLGIHSQLFPLDMTVATRWIYSGALGFSGVAIFFVSILANKFLGYKKQHVFLGVSLVILIFFGTISHLRTQVWKSGYALYSTDIENNPESFDLNNNYGVELFRSGQKDRALGYLEKSISLQPNWSFPWNNAGAVYEYQGDLEKAKKYYLKSIEKGQYFLAYENYASILIRQEKYTEANKFVTDALRYLPNNEKLNYFKLYISRQWSGDPPSPKATDGQGRDQGER